MSRTPMYFGCIVSGCDRQDHAAHGYCGKHYQRELKAGRTWPKPTFEQSFWAKVEKTGECWIWTASTTRGYGVIRRDTKPFYAHRLSYEWARGPIPTGMYIDHICRNPLCVRPDHLRVTTNKENNENHNGPTRRSTSGIRGVTWNKRKGKWFAHVRHNGRQHSCGYHADLAEAEKAVLAKRLELHTHNDLDRKAMAV